MAQQMFGNQQGGGLGTTPIPIAPQMPVATPNAVAPATPNADPMAQMMQQMMGNPAMMQQSMQMAQQMFGNQGNGAGFPGGYGNFGSPLQFPPVAAPGTDSATQALGAAIPGAEAMTRA